MKDHNKKLNIVNDYTHVKECKHIYRWTNKHTKDVKYQAVIEIKGRKFKKLFDCLKQAKKYVDLKCIENKREQVYNSFKMV